MYLLNEIFMNYTLPGAIYSAILTTAVVYIQKVSLSPRKDKIYFYIAREFKFPENAMVTSEYDSVTQLEVMILEQEEHIHHAVNYVTYARQYYNEPLRN